MFSASKPLIGSLVPEFLYVGLRIRLLLKTYRKPQHVIHMKIFRLRLVAIPGGYELQDFAWMLDTTFQDLWEHLKVALVAGGVITSEEEQQLTEMLAGLN